MGGSQSTVSVTEDFLPAQPPLESHGTLKQFRIVDGGAFVGSGQRMYKSYRVRQGKTSTTTTTTTINSKQQQEEENHTEVVAVLKVAYLQSRALSSNAQQQQAEQLQALSRELQHIQQLTEPLPHVWPITTWFGPDSFAAAAPAASQYYYYTSYKGGGIGGTGSGGGISSSGGGGVVGGLSSTSTDGTASSAVTSLSTSSAAAAATTTGPSTVSAVTAATSTTTTNTNTTVPSSSSSSSSASGGGIHPVLWLRPHVYTTLGDRLTNRPWLDGTEKLFLIYQLLRAVQSLHDVGLVHGALTTQNIGYTSQGWLVLLDVMPTSRSSSTPGDGEETPSSSTSSTSSTSSSSGESNHGEHHLPLSFRPIRLPHDDPTEYLYCFSNKKCYLAPERFDDKNNRTGSGNNNRNSDSNVLTPAMDIFSLGCCLVELVLNGEACFDLGQLLEYRKTASGSSITSGPGGGGAVSSSTSTASTSSALAQKLQKMESSALRAACRHMLSLDPKVRLTAQQYLERLQGQGIIPKEDESPIFESLYQLLRQQQGLDTPDARFYHLYKAFPEVLFQTMGIRNVSTAATEATSTTTTPPKENPQTSIGTRNEGTTTTTTEVDPRVSSPFDLWTETEALLKELQDLDNENTNNNIVPPLPTAAAPKNTTPETKAGSSSSTDPRRDSVTPNDANVEARTPLENSCLLIYVQLVLNTLRHVQRPATKLIALQLIQHVLPHVGDDARLQRIVPVTVALLKDSDALVRAATLQTLTRTLALLTSFPPSDAQVMPQYIFKRVAPLLTDPCLSVRLALAQNMGSLAETAQRFLDISQAVRLIQAVEGNSGAQTPNLTSANSRNNLDDTGIFEEKVTQLLDETPSGTLDAESSSHARSSSSQRKQQQSGVNGGTFLVRSSYQAERSGLAETVSRWVVHICTDQSENASTVKRALLSHALEGLCNFFFARWCHGVYAATAVSVFERPARLGVASRSFCGTSRCMPDYWTGSY